MSIRKLLLTVLVLLVATDAWSQSVTGVIFDDQTLDPLAGAAVLEADSNRGTATDEDGTFELQLSGDGLTEISVRYLGYATRTVTVQPGDELRIGLERRALQTGEVFVQALRADESSPIAYTNINREEIDQQNFGRDLPFLVNSTPSVVSTSDAGAGVGYTGLRIRGVDQTRINVTMNGIPVNDGESQNVFWVNMPDLASSVENIQIQRGVGSSTHGAGAFGATMNIQTGRMEAEPFGEVSSTIGSYNTRMFNVQIGSGEIGDGWNLEGRLSKMDSDGYIDRAASDLRSLNLSASRQGEQSLLKMDLITGQEKTYQAWNGVPEPILENDSGELERYIANLGGDANRLRENLGNRRFNEFTYQNQTDNYQQDHYHLHYSWRASDTWRLNSSLHYTYGRGYFEEFRAEDDLSTYQIDPVEIGGKTIEQSDLVRRRWLDNHFYGAIFSSEWTQDQWDLTVGGAYNEYDGDHFGEVIWARYAGESMPEDRYYNNNGFKTDGNVYGKFNYYLRDGLNTYVDLQLRRVTYQFLGLRVEETQGGQEIRDLEQQVTLDFFNPKVGLVWQVNNQHRLFASLSVGSREPGRRDYVESTPESRPSPERLYDYEVGYEGEFERFRAGLNLYYMDYRDQLILTGAVNDVGAYVRENVDRSYRAGIELHGGVQLTRAFSWSGNLTLSRNRIPEYVHYLDNFDEGGQTARVYDQSRIAFSPDLISSSSLQFNRGSWRAAWNAKYVSRQYLDNTSTTSRSIDPYLVNDFRAGYRIDNTLWASSIDLQFQVNNLLDTRYVSNGYTFGWIAGGDEQHFNYFYPQAGRNILFKLTIGL
ncbi:MAG: TonB-dependent receptor [Balneolaceae bacterium]